MKIIYLIYERQPDGIRWKESFTVPNSEDTTALIEIEKYGKRKITVAIRKVEPEALRQLIAWAEKGERPTVIVKDFKEEVNMEVGKADNSKSDRVNSIPQEVEIKEIPTPQPNPEAEDKKGLPR